MSIINVNDLNPAGSSLLEGFDSFVDSSVNELSDTELKVIVGGGSKSSGGGVAIVNNIAYGYGGGIFGPVTNIVGGGNN
jgi:hypothetical protein